MTASELKEWVAIFLPDLVDDGAGGCHESVPAGLVADTPAKVAIRTANPVMQGDQLGDRATLTVTVRYQNWVTSNYRVMWRDRLLDITGVRNLEDAGDAWLEIDCLRREAGTQ